MPRARTMVCVGVAGMLAMAAACDDDGGHAADVASFDRVWTAVRDRHFDPTFGGLDWDAVRAEVRPKVVAAHDRAEVRRLIAEMIGRLHVSHMVIVPQHHARDLSESVNGTGMVGLTVRMLDGAAVVTEVEKGGPGERGHVHAGWIVQTIGGTPVADLLAPVRKSYAGRPDLAAFEAITIDVALLDAQGSTTKVIFRDGNGRAVVVPLEHDAPTGLVKFGNFGPLPVSYVSTWLAAQVKYVRLNAFFDAGRVMPWFRDDIATMNRSGARGLVLDLRGNTGGLGPMALGIAGRLIQKDLVVGTERDRDSSKAWTAHPQADHYDGPVAVLVDEESASTSEILADALQASGRARVFGRRTMGAALPSTVELLPNGDLFQYPVADYVSASGRRLEGNGIVPDEPIALDRASLLAGRDDDLDAALHWIASQPPQETSP